MEAKGDKSWRLTLNLTNHVSLYALPAHGKERMMEVVQTGLWPTIVANEPEDFSFAEAPF